MSRWTQFNLFFISRRGVLYERMYTILRFNIMVSDILVLFISLESVNCSMYKFQNFVTDDFVSPTIST